MDITIPLTTSYLSTLRMLAASLGADAGFSVDEIDDLRLALSEAVTMIAEQRSSTRLLSCFSTSGNSLTVRLTTDDDSAELTPDHLASTILASVVDEHDFANGAIILRKTATDRHNFGNLR